MPELPRTVLGRSNPDMTGVDAGRNSVTLPDLRVGEPAAYATGSPELKATGPSHVGLLTPRSPRIRCEVEAGAYRWRLPGEYE